MIRIKLFAAAKQFAGIETATINVDGPVPISELRRLLVEEHPSLEAILPSVRFAINTEYVSDDTLASEGDEVAVIPPVSGG